MEYTQFEGGGRGYILYDIYLRYKCEITNTTLSIAENLGGH